MHRVVATLFALSLAACGSSGTDTPTAPGGRTGPDISGTYILKTVDNKALPVVSGDSTFLSGQIVISDSTWKQTVVVRYAQGGSGSAAGDSLVQAGLWTTTPSTVRLFDYGLGETYTGTLTSNGFTLTSKTSTLLGYSK
jgi:hypothetical protein